MVEGDFFFISFFFLLVPSSLFFRSPKASLMGRKSVAIEVQNEAYCILKNIEILERLQLIVVQSVMRVIMEKSELVQREGDVRDEKRAIRVPS